MIAVCKDLDLGSSSGWTSIRGIHSATRRSPVGSSGGHSVKVRVAIVSQEQFHRRAGEHGDKGPLDYLDDLGLSLRHIQCVGEPTLELLALCLRVPDLCLLVSFHHGRAELVVETGGIGDSVTELTVETHRLFRRCNQLAVEALHLLVGTSLLAFAENDEHKRDREHDSQDDSYRYEVPVDSRCQRLTQEQARNEDEAKGAKSDDGADQTELGRPRDLSGPFLFSDHVHPQKMCLLRQFSVVDMVCQDLERPTLRCSHEGGAGSGLSWRIRAERFRICLLVVLRTCLIACEKTPVRGGAVLRAETLSRLCCP